MEETATTKKLSRANLLLCSCTMCISAGALKIKERLETELRKYKLEKEIEIVPTGSSWFCRKGPTLIVQPDGVVYQLLKEEDIPYLVEEHLLKGRPVKRLMHVEPEEKKPIPKLQDIPFYKQQRLVALWNRGVIDPESIDEYIGRGGYRGLAKVLQSMTPEAVIKEVKESGLRGRGGAGFPTGKKWEFCRKNPAMPKYIICNADEGDPGAFMDRSIIEADPHSVIEGMAIGGFAISAEKGIVYIRAEYPLAIERLILAIKQAREYGLLGKNIFGLGFNFDIEIFRGAGAYVCGEATSMVASIEGKPAEPRQRPPRLTDAGLWGQPTVLNNVETFANVPKIISFGAKWFASIGTETSKGTKVFSVAGHVNDAGLVEVPMGISLKEIIFGICGGIPDNRPFKAVQIGGPSGGFLPERLLHLPVDYESLEETGTIMGSGGMVVMNDRTCIVDMAKYFVNFLRDESCGKCASCREGVQAMYDILFDICEGKGRKGDIEILEELSETISEASLCGLGESAPVPVKTAIMYFKDEIEAHIRDKKCPGGICKALIKYRIEEDKCTGCVLCAKKCPAGAITGEAKKVYKINPDKCIKCSVCSELCKFGAIIVE